MECKWLSDFKLTDSVTSDWPECLHTTTIFSSSYHSSPFWLSFQPPPAPSFHLPHLPLLALFFDLKSSHPFLPLPCMFLSHFLSHFIPAAFPFPGSPTSCWNCCCALQDQLQIRWRQIHPCSLYVSSISGAQCLHTKYYNQFSTEQHWVHDPGQNGSVLLCVLQLSPWKLLWTHPCTYQCHKWEGLCSCIFDI